MVLGVVVPESSSPRGVVWRIWAMVVVVVVAQSFTRVQFPWAVVADSQDFNLSHLLTLMEDKASEFARVVQESYKTKPCSSSTCERSNYNFCKSALNSATKECPAADPGTQLLTTACGDGNVCNGWVDFGFAGVNVPAMEPLNQWGTPLNPEVTESICIGNSVDVWMKGLHQDISHSISTHTELSETPFLFFGASNGVFRMYPARPWKTCDFDPGQRPWYVAASSTPKAIVIVLDTATTTVDFALAKRTAQALVQAMAHADRVSVVLMGNVTEIVHVVGNLTDDPRDFVMDKATHQVQEKLQHAIAQRQPSLTIDAEGALQSTFTLLENTIAAHGSAICNVGVVLLTSETHLPVFQEMQDFITQQRRRVEALTGRTLLFFGYHTGSTRLSENAMSLECSLGAVWSIMMEDGGRDNIAQNVRLFHEAFALDLGRTIRDGAAPSTWSPVYQFFSLQIPGTTVAAPVFDTTQNPPLFLGVVGMDVALKALEDMAPESTVRTEIEKRHDPRQRCGPSFTPCDLEALRRRSRFFMDALGSNASTLCGNVCPTQDGPNLDRATVCSLETLPDNVWNNLDEEDVEYRKRACCAVGPSDNGNEVDQCTVDDKKGWNVRAVVGIGSAFVLLVLACMGVKRCCRNTDSSRIGTAVEEQSPLGQRQRSPSEASVEFIKQDLGDDNEIRIETADRHDNNKEEEEMASAAGVLSTGVPQNICGRSIDASALTEPSMEGGQHETECPNKE